MAKVNKLKKKLAITGMAVALTAGIGITAASASGNSGNEGDLGVTFQTGAVDLNGNPVNSKVLITDTLPDDLGTLEYSGSQTAGSGTSTGSFE